MPEISVVLPVYNGQEYIKESIQSILQQEFSDFELIITDDASLDKTPEIVASFSDSRIRYTRQESNRGIFGNINAGFQLTKAPFVQIFSQDDVMLPACLEEQKKKFERFPKAGMVFCRFQSINAAGNIAPQNFDPRMFSEIPPLIPVEHSFRFFTAFGCLPGNISTVMLRKESFLEVGKFNENLPYVGDFEYWVRLGKQYPITFNSDKLVLVRGHKKQGGHVLNKNLELLQQEIPLWISLIHSFPQEKIASVEEYVLKIRGAQYMHWIVKVLLKGKWKIARKGLTQLQAPFSLLRLLKAYIVTLNSRIKPPWSQILEEYANSNQ
ncbi:MAG: glycosyltransferase [SAR324 cluster bacterium]|nr:glycosyltransferase [SAR324 cluster bacterium]